MDAILEVVVLTVIHIIRDIGYWLIYGLVRAVGIGGAALARWVMAAARRQGRGRRWSGGRG